MGNSVLASFAAKAPVMKTVSLPRGRHRLHAMPTTLGYEIRRDSSYEWNGRLRGSTPFTVWQYTVAGTGNLQYERRRYRIEAGDAMLVIVPHNHRYWVEDGGSWEFFWLSMSGEEAVRIHRAIQATAGPVLHMKPRTVEHMARCCLRLIDGEGETAGSASAIAYEAAMALYDDVFSSPPVHEDNEFASIHRVVEYIRANIDKDLTVDVLAEVAGFSRSHFSRLFVVQTGTSPAGFVLQERMRRAVRLLTAHSSLPIKQVSALSGFADPNYFAKVFQRYFATSPTKFRATKAYPPKPSSQAGHQSGDPA